MPLCEPQLSMPELDGNDIHAKRMEIKAYFQYCYKRYESLFETIADEKLYFQKADPLRQPLIFYYGHTAVFFINKLKLAKIIDQRIDPYLESIFAVGVDEMSWDDLNDQHYSWPTLKQTQKYRDSVYNLVSELTDKLPLTLPITWESPWWVILMGIEHENIHLETSSVLIRQLPLEGVENLPAWQVSQRVGSAPVNTLVPVPSGSVHLGKVWDDHFYGWDNEYGIHHANIPAFKASKYLVSNAEYSAFIEEGGYHNDSFWDEEGNAWRMYQKANRPRFWIEKEDGYYLRTMTEEISLPMNWPVEVNCLEAEAFCRWKSQKEGRCIVLPTEDEYMRLYDFSQLSGCKGSIEEGQSDSNIALTKAASSTPVDCCRHGDFFDITGNVWQWTRTPMYPYEGFKVHPVYDDFTVPTFDGKHNLIKGGSWISSGNLAGRKSRYAFRKHFYQHAGFRYIESEYEEKIMTNAYTTDGVISQYCHFGWGENRLGVENYPAKCARMALEYMGSRPRKRAFDVGCAIGRSSFELAREFDEVIGVDFSARFIQEAQRFKESGVLRYTMPIEGELEEFHEVRLNRFGLEHASKKVNFWQADACNLKPIFTDFDLVFAGNLIDRLYDPQKFLESMAGRIRKGGLLVLTSPYTWQEESTPREKWIGGYKRDGENVTALQGLEEILGDDFTLLDTEDIPFVIQETARKHQYTIAQMSIWERR